MLAVLLLLLQATPPDSGGFEQKHPIFTAKLKAGDPLALTMYGMMAHDAGDMAIAATLLEGALAAGDPMRLAGGSLCSLRAEEDDAEKVRTRWRQVCEKAATDGDPLAAYTLAREDAAAGEYRTAVKWARQAAEADCEEAGRGAACALSQLILGTAYLTGQGVPQDYVQAHLWSNLAGANIPSSGRGDWAVKAAENRRSAEARLTSGQVAEAQRLAREWAPKPTGLPDMEALFEKYGWNAASEAAPPQTE